MRHELHLTKAALRMAVPTSLVLVTAGALTAGGRGATSAALGAGLVIVNQIAAAASTGWARTLGPSVVAVGYAVFVARMFAMFAAFAVLATVAWISAPILAAAFCGVLVVGLVGQCLGYARGTYLPDWRLAR